MGAGAHRHPAECGGDRLPPAPSSPVAVSGLATVSVPAACVAVCSAAFAPV